MIKTKIVVEKDLQCNSYRFVAVALDTAKNLRFPVFLVLEMVT